MKQLGTVGDRDSVSNFLGCRRVLKSSMPMAAAIWYISSKTRQTSGPVATAAENRKIRYLPSILGGVFLLAGVALIVKSRVDPKAAAAHRR